jgi:hypothetical protein
MLTHFLFALLSVHVWVEAKPSKQGLTTELSDGAFCPHPTAVVQWGLTMGWQGVYWTLKLARLESKSQSKNAKKNDIEC